MAVTAGLRLDQTNNLQNGLSLLAVFSLLSTFYSIFEQSTTRLIIYGVMNNHMNIL